MLALVMDTVAEPRLEVENANRLGVMETGTDVGRFVGEIDAR
jgi:hypothetical protein